MSRTANEPPKTTPVAGDGHHGRRTEDGAAPAGSLCRLSLDQWQDYMHAHPDRTAFHHRRWIELLTEQYHFPLHVWGVRHGSAVTAAVPLLETRKPWGTKKLIALPFTDSFRMLADDRQSLRLLLDGLRQQTLGRYRAVVLRSETPHDLPREAGSWVRHEMATDRSWDELVGAFSSGTRANLRKAQRAGLRFARRDDVEAMDIFYRLHLATRRKHGVPIQPRSFFSRYYDNIIRPGFGFIAVISKDNRPIAAGVFMLYNRTMIYKYGASDPRALAARPNELMFSRTIRLASEQGCERLDFGRSDARNPGLCRFKRKFGAIESSLEYEYLVGQPPAAGAEHSWAERIGGQAIRRSPSLVCRALGEVLYKYSQ